MARPVSEKVKTIQRELRERLASEALTPGRGFFSNRSLAAHYGISYQTAHRILSSLAGEGLLSRRQGAAALVPGEFGAPTRVALVMAPRAFEEGTFGNHLRGLLEAALRAEGIDFAHVAADAAEAIPAEAYPVFWNVDLPPAFLRMKRFCLLLNARPALGLGAGWVDTISVDNYSGGLLAGELLRERCGVRRAAVLGGPEGDPRSRARIAGFQSVFPRAEVVQAGSWGYRVPASVLRALRDFEPDGVFCVNDRLAIRLKGSFRDAEQLPRIIGFDNTPAAAGHELTTIAIPWTPFVRAAIEVIRARMRGRRDATRDQILRLEPVLRA
ncbi:MAG: substrate-binding domain-containing protein, partial [Puniceicoccaceae bacterium]